MILMESMITTGGIYKLPKGVGTLGVFKKHQEYKPLNYQHFKETGELIPLANLHSSKYIFKFSWLKHTAFRHMGANTYVSDAIKFRPARYFTRRLAYNIKNNLNIIAFRDRNDYKIR